LENVAEKGCIAATSTQTKQDLNELSVFVKILYVLNLIQTEERLRARRENGWFARIVKEII
jgi:hypothetical protein